jgi:hypothetical protein
MGWNIIPLSPCQKTPATSHGVKDTTTDESKIREWWSLWPDANIGLACGENSGVYVIDIDVSETKNGFDSLKEFPQLPETIRQDTPSGGAHLFYAASDPPRNRNSFRSGIDIRGDGYYVVLPPSIHPNRGEYKWRKGNEPWTTKIAEYPEWMRPLTISQFPTSANIVTNVVLRERNTTNLDVIRRASMYLATCDPAIQGQAGHDKLLYAASRMVHGFLLTDEQTYDLLSSEYNPRCEPPWDLSTQKDERDFRRKISEARKLTPNNPEGWLLNDSSFANTSDCNIDLSLLLKGNSSESEFCQDKEYEFLIKPPGLLGEICSWINSTAIKEQPFLSVGCALAFLGALFGRKVKDKLGSRTNLYCMGVAPSSAGKAHAVNQMRRLASAAGATSLLGGDSIASDSAIEDRIYREPSTIFMLDEIGFLLSHIKSGTSHHHAQVISLLMKLYSSAGNIYLGKEYAEQEKQRVITQPCCCIYGTSTMDRFAGGLSPVELQDGWLSRCLVFQSNIEAIKKRGRDETGVPSILSEEVNKWYTRIIDERQNPQISNYVDNHFQKKEPIQLVVDTTKEAECEFVNFDNECMEYGKIHGLLSCLFAKGEENARRIGLIIACGCNFDNPLIDLTIANFACRLIRYILIDFVNHVAPEIVEGRTDSDKNKIIKVISYYGSIGCERYSISRSTRNLNQKIRNELLSDLIESGEIAYQKIESAYRYWTPDNYLKYLECNKSQ